jgi:hypothetical protein
MIRLRALVASVVVLILPSAELIAYQTPSETGSMIYSGGGTASINGSGIGQSGALFDGDILDTGNSPLTITRKGSTVTSAPNSKLAIQQNNLHLGCGEATVKTVSGMSTLVQGYGITPSGLNGRYQVIQKADHMQLLSLEGDTWLYAGSRQVTVPAGQMISLPGECMDDAALKASASGPAVNSPSNFTPIATGKVSKTLIIATGAALAGGGVLAWYELSGGSKKPVSPAAP